MSISETDVRHLASLARLEVSDSRVQALLRELNGILVHMDVLQRMEMSGADTRAGAESAGSRDIATPLRADEPSAEPLTRSLSQLAPAERDGFFLVPRLATHE